MFDTMFVILFTYMYDRMNVRTCLLFCAVIHCCFCIIYEYDNITFVEPALRQMYDFKQQHKKPVGLLTTGTGEPIDIRDIFTLNSDQFSNAFQVDYHLGMISERTPERVVHAKGTGAEGYFEVTNDVTKYTSADLFSEVGKKTPVITRFSVSMPSQGGTDLLKEFKSMSVKFYTEEGNLDLLCFQAPIYSYKDPINFPTVLRAFKRNPHSHLPDPTTVWDLVTLRPENFHSFLWAASDYGLPNGYRKMDVFAIHTYEISNKNGKKYYVKFNFRTEQGLDNLTNAQAAAIQSTDLDYYIRDLYNAIKRKDFPSWLLEMDVLTPNDLKNVDYDPFDVTRIWKNGTYKTVPIGRLTLTQIPKNHFRSIEQLALNPANLVPGIPGPVDILFKARRLAYRTAQNYRIGGNHNKLEVNLPKYSRTYNRDGVPPSNDNMEDIPNYFPNSFSGPVPYVDNRRPDKKLTVIETNAIDLQPSADFYNNILTNDAQRERLAQTLATSLVNVNPPVRKRSVKFMYLIDEDLGRRVDTSLKAALEAASANKANQSKT